MNALTSQIESPVGGSANQLELRLSFYDQFVSVRTQNAALLRRVANDFSYFVLDDQKPCNSSEMVIQVRHQSPDYSGLPAIKASVYTPRNICFTKDDITFIDYFGRALSIFDRSNGSLEVFGEDLNLLHEIIYLSILSRVCESLEKRRMHRVHALSFESGHQAALFMMPSGCGKTTLAMQVLGRGTDWRLISEDSPLIDASGKVVPFPLRFGVLGKAPEGIAPEHVTYFQRMEFEPKYLISLKAFGDSVSHGPSTPKFLFLCDRLLGHGIAVKEVGYFVGFKGLLRHMIVGVGLYQGLEFLLRSSVVDLWKMTGLFWSRLRRAHTMLRQSRVFTLQLGRDPAENAARIMKFLEDEGFGVSGQ